MAATHFSGPLYVGGVPTMGMGGFPPFTGTYYFVDAVNGSNGNSGSASSPLATVYSAFSRCTAGNNDVVVIVGNGGTGGTQRLSLANAQAVDSTVTAGTLVWNKAATHMIGMTAPTQVAQRARFAPPTGVYTQATFGSGNFVTVSASGCYFSNFSLFNGFSTGGVNQICWTDTGGRNYYDTVEFGGMGDAASATDTGSRSLKISTAGENTFVNCTIGVDTVDRTVANASLEFAGGTPRNTFLNCNFPVRATNAGVLGILGTGASCMDRYQLFTNCGFLNAMSSGATAQTVIASLTSASPGGLMMMNNCYFIGNASTNWGDTNGLANMYVMGGSPTAATNGIAINPS